MECVWPAECVLGEGPMWDVRSQTLRFVDLKAGLIHHYDPATGARETADVGGLPCFVVPSDDGGFVVGRGHALHLFDGTTLGAEIARVDMPDHNRFNDATVDPQGRLWFGSMDNLEKAATGAVHLHDRGTVFPVGGECEITNGPAVSGDGRWLYHVDTLGGIIWRFDIAEDPMLTDGIEFARIAPEDGFPDGVTIDSEDHVWVGLWGGWQARRYAPDGSLAQTVALPVANVTKLAFGGPDLRTAFATTARIGIAPDALEAQPLAGGLFAFRVDVPGRALPEVRLAPLAAEGAHRG